jgi:hypothetical protein
MELSRLWRRYYEIQQIQKVARSPEPVESVSLQTKVRFSKLHNTYHLVVKAFNRLSLLKKVNESVVIPNPLDLDLQAQSYQRLQQIHHTHLQTLRNQESLNKELIKVAARLKSVDHELKHLKATIGDLEFCPVCNGPLQLDFLAKIPVG